MQLQYDLSMGQPTTPDIGDELLRCRMGIVGLDVGAVERDYSATFEKLSQRCLNCRHRATCMVDLTRTPMSVIWEAYCPNANAVNALLDLTEAVS